MQQIRNHHKQKRAGKPNSFVSVNSTWCTVEYVKITFPDEMDDDIDAIRELLAYAKINENQRLLK